MVTSQVVSYVERWLMGLEDIGENDVWPTLGPGPAMSEGGARLVFQDDSEAGAVDFFTEQVTIWGIMGGAP